MNKTRRIVTTTTVALVSALALAACGTAKPPTYQGGGNGGAQTTTTPSSSSTTPVTSRSPVGATGSPTWVAAQYVALAWSLDPTWPNENYAYVLERPYLTPAMNAYDVRQATRPAQVPVVAKWKQDVRFKAGSYALVTAAWIVTDAGVTPTTCIVNVDFLLGTTLDGVKQSTAGSTIVDAFKMQKIGGTWYVASQPQLPQ